MTAGIPTTPAIVAAAADGPARCADAKTPTSGAEAAG